MSYGPWASLRPSRRAARQRARSGSGQSASGRGRAGVQRMNDVQIGPWRLTINHVGDLVAHHQRNGLVQVIALNSEETDGL